MIITFTIICDQIRKKSMESGMFIEWQGIRDLYRIYIMHNDFSTTCYF